MSSSLVRSFMELRTSFSLISAAPRAVSLATHSRVRWLNSKANNVAEPLKAAPELKLQPSAVPPPAQSAVPSKPSLPSAAAAADQAAPSPSVLALLPFLAAQPSHYITLHIHGRPYLVTPGDSIRLPFKMPGVVPGDVLRFDTATTLGSRDFTLKGQPYINQRYFECRAVVTGVEAEPLRLKVKKKRRTRRSQTIRSKHKYTVLRISDLKIIVPESHS